MKKGIHPEYQEAAVKCVCGNEFKTRSTLKEISVEICAACHPFFTGQQKLVDSAGRVERFMKKYGKEYAVGEKKAAPKPEAPATEPEAEKVPSEPDKDAPAAADGEPKETAKGDTKPSE